MGREEEIIKERERKLKELVKEGINPYPASFDKKNTCAEAASSKIGKTVVTAGRLMNKRDLGKIIFSVLRDGSGDIQLVFQEGKTPEKTTKFFQNYFDVGDIVGISGEVFKTKTGQISILVDKVTMLSKSLLPLPEKWHGIQDDDERLRKRYLDIAINKDVMEMFVRKSKFWQTIRQFMLDNKFLEVETPVLENVTGGAEAKPFITHHNALNTDVYLRISDELWLKRLIVAGFPKVFEIGRIFRNEGMDAEHLQDYTQMEFYWAYADYNDGMKLVEEMYKKIAKEVFGTLKFKIREFDVDLSKKWEIYDYVSTVKKMTGVDVLKADLKQMEKKLGELKIDYEKKGLNYNRAVDSLWKFCRRKISGPGFLINVPIELEPLAKKSEKNPRVVERFQIILAGSEMGKGFSELNDPLDQMSRFEYQKKLREQGDEEAQMNDESFVEALKHGMPPTCGFGVSERFFSFLENKPIRETVIFPLMKPEKEESSDKKGGLKLAVAIINKSLKLRPWEEMNTIAHLTSAFGARSGSSLFHQDKIETKDGEKINLNIQHAIITKEAGSNKELLDLIGKAREMHLHVAEFTREMLETTNDKKIIELTKNKNHKDIEYLGVLIFGDKKDVESLTSKYDLFK